MSYSRLWQCFSPPNDSKNSHRTFKAKKAKKHSKHVLIIPMILFPCTVTFLNFGLFSNKLFMTQFSCNHLGQMVFMGRDCKRPITKEDVRHITRWQTMASWRRGGLHRQKSEYDIWKECIARNLMILLLFY